MAMYKADRETSLLLKQIYGLSPGKIHNVITSYVRNTPVPHNDEGLLKYCKCITRPLYPIQIPIDWMPSLLPISDIPREIAEEYIPLFKKTYQVFPIKNGNYNSLYESFCKLKWEFDSRNSKAKGPTFMTMAWNPSESMVNLLSLLNIKEANLIVEEFKLYWTEAGIMRKNWDLLLIEHLKRSTLKC